MNKGENEAPIESDGIMHIGKNGTGVKVNPAFSTATGITRNTANREQVEETLREFERN